MNSRLVHKPTFFHVSWRRGHLNSHINGYAGAYPLFPHPSSSTRLTPIRAQAMAEHIPARPTAPLEFVPDSLGTPCCQIHMSSATATGVGSEMRMFAGDAWLEPLRPKLQSHKCLNPNGSQVSKEARASQSV